MNSLDMIELKMVELQFCPNDIVVFSIIYQLCFCVFAALSKKVSSKSSILPNFHLAIHQYILIPTKKLQEEQSDKLTKLTTMVRSHHHLRLGAHAICSVLLSMLRPSAIIDARIPNCHAQMRLKDLVAVRIANTTHGG